MSKVKIYDISMPVHENMQVYKNNEEKKPVFSVIRDFTNGDAFETNVKMDMHTGTHMDAPLHMVEGGETIDKTDLTKCITLCRVIDCTEIEGCVKKSDLEKKDIKPGEFILLKTKNSFTEQFEYDFVYLEKSGARYLQEMKITGVGIDALGIERSQKGHETHKLLLGSNILIIEGLRLKDIRAGEYLLIALPLKMEKLEAAPVRAVLIEKDAWRNI